MGPLEILESPAWRPLTWTLLHFAWQGAVVALVWLALFRLTRGNRTQFRYLLGLAGMFLMAVCPVATFLVLESEAGRQESHKTIAPMLARSVADVPKTVPLPTTRLEGLRDVPAVDSAAAPWRLDVTGRIGDVQPYLLGGWIVGLVFFSGRLLLGVVGAKRLGRGRLALSGEMARRTAAIAGRLGFRAVPRVFSAKAAREAVVTGLLRPIVLLPAAWLVEMPPEVLEAVVAHELAHIRRYDLWLNVFQRLVETLLFYHPAVWWLSRRVRLAREMCCDEMAAAATGERVVYATALELAARKRLEPAKSLLEVALGVTRMTLLDRVRNILGLAARHEQARWWPAAILTLLVPPAIWLASMAAATSAQEKKPAEASPLSPAEKPSQKPAAVHSWDWAATSGSIPADAKARHTATALLRISLDDPAMRGSAVPTDRTRFDIYRNTQAQLLQCGIVLRAALKNPAVAKLPSVQRQMAAGDAKEWLAERLKVTFPGDAEIMKVSIRSDDRKEAVTLVNAVVDGYMAAFGSSDHEKLRQRLSEVEKYCDVKMQEMRGKQDQLMRMVKNAGSSRVDVLNVQQKLVLEQLALYRSEMARSVFEVKHCQADLEGQEALLKDAKLDERGPILKEINRLKAVIATMTKQNADMANRLQDMIEEAKQFGRTSVAVEMLRSDIKNLETVLASFSSEREKLRVEINTPPRVTLLEHAE